MQTFLHRLLDNASLRLAVAGDGSGNLEIASRPNFIYAQLGGEGENVAEVRTGAVRPNYGDFVYVQAENPALPQTWRTAFWLRDGSDATLPAPVVGVAGHGHDRFGDL